MKLLRRWDVILGILGSLILILGAWLQFLPLGLTEVFGFVTGAVNVWLVVKENIWNWPIGIVNNIFFIILFLSSQLYADTGLQVVYIVLGGLGWYWWLRGGQNKRELAVGKTSFSHLAIVMGLVAISTALFTVFLEQVGDSAPFWDAFTTMLSLAAQYLLTRKLIENWYIWITADIIYIALYAYKQLYLTSFLYFIFMLMCLAGLVQWRKSLPQEAKELVAIGEGNV